MTCRETGINPTRETHAFRIWQTLNATEGDMSIADLSRRLDIHKDTVRAIVRERGWNVRNARADSIHAYNAARTEPQELVFE